LGFDFLDKFGYFFTTNGFSLAQFPEEVFPRLINKAKNRPIPFLPRFLVL